MANEKQIATPKDRLAELEDIRKELLTDYNRSETMSRVVGLGDPAIMGLVYLIEAEIKAIQISKVTPTFPTNVNNIHD